MTKEYEKLLDIYISRVELYFKENNFNTKERQGYIFWKAYIKYCIDTNYSSLASDIFNKLVTRGIIVCDNNPYCKLYHHRDYIVIKKFKKLDWN